MRKSEMFSLDIFIYEDIPPPYAKKQVTLQNTTLGEDKLFCEKKFNF